MHSREIRAKYLEFFQKRDHRLVPSDKLIPSNDPTLLFTSAGMVQFKDNYLGRSADPTTRATSCQKCFRTTDIDNVGYTARHHTFFEMLGNFSFGDYFKREAIHWGWEFVTEVLRLDPDRLHPTVYLEDDDAFAIWEKEIGVPGEKIGRLGKDENFWGPVGGSGPCGPCSEILYDQGSHIEDEDDRYLEIWNLVFPQFDAQPDGTFPELARKGIDTGAGLERMAAVMQKVDTNFETDLFIPYVAHLEEISGRAFKSSHEATCSMRVVADHVRATTFAIGDRIVPSNVGRGYVLRRIMRRAMLHGQRLGMGQGFFAGMIPIVVETMKQIYPELDPAREHIQKVVSGEEEAFHRTLSRGSAILRERIEELCAKGESIFPGSEAFRLYDTYGFPLELTLEVLADNGMTCAREEFEERMEDQRQRAKAAWKGSGMQALAEAEGIELVPSTEFVGYDTTECEAEVLYLFDGKVRTDTLSAGMEGAIALDRTPFYAESGGQATDKGILAADGLRFEVTDTQKSANEVYLHQGKVLEGTLRPGMTVSASVDPGRRGRILPHHTGAHLLQAALRGVLGNHVHQQGSFVGPDNLRFDFTHPEAMGREQIGRVEGLVNQWTREDHPVEMKHSTLEEARAAGAMALFGEKYGEVVRMVKIEPISLELCGGTHVHRTGEIGPFVILSEESIQAGVRRITAVAGERAYEEIKQRDEIIGSLSFLLKCPPLQIPERIERLQSQLREKDKIIRTLQEKGSGTAVSDLLSSAKKVHVGADVVPLLVARVEALDTASLEATVDRVKQKLPESVILLGAEIDGKVHFVCSIGKTLTGVIQANNLVKKVAAVAGGGGGGRADWAKAGGKDPEKLDVALASVEGFLR